MEQEDVFFQTLGLEGYLNHIFPLSDANILIVVYGGFLKLYRKVRTQLARVILWSWVRIIEVKLPIEHALYLVVFYPALSVSGDCRQVHLFPHLYDIYTIVATNE